MYFIFFHSLNIMILNITKYYNGVAGCSDNLVSFQINWLYETTENFSLPDPLMPFARYKQNGKVWTRLLAEKLNAHRNIQTSRNCYGSSNSQFLVGNTLNFVVKLKFVFKIWSSKLRNTSYFPSAMTLV